MFHDRKLNALHAARQKKTKHNFRVSEKVDLKWLFAPESSIHVFIKTPKFQSKMVKKVVTNRLQCSKKLNPTENRPFQNQTKSSKIVADNTYDKKNVSSHFLLLNTLVTGWNPELVFLTVVIPNSTAKGCLFYFTTLWNRYQRFSLLYFREEFIIWPDFEEKNLKK